MREGGGENKRIDGKGIAEQELGHDGMCLVTLLDKVIKDGVHCVEKSEWVLD